MRHRVVMTAGAGSLHDYPAGDLPPPLDVAARLAPEPVYLLPHHNGGVVGLNLFAGDAAARIATVDTFRVSGLTDYRLAREQMAEQPLPAFSTWTPDAAGGVKAVLEVDRSCHRVPARGAISSRARASM